MASSLAFGARFGYGAGMSKNLLLLLLSGVAPLTGCGLELGYPGDGKPVENSDALRIFVVGNVKGDMNGRNGVTGADELCDESAAKPNQSRYKALLVDGSARVAAPGSQVDWVLRPDRNYYRANGTTLVGKTTSEGLFTFPLANRLQTAGTYVWTGLAANWQLAADDCARWTSVSTTTVKGQVGQSSGETSAFLAAAQQTCGSVASLYCVEQP